MTFNYVGVLDPRSSLYEIINNNIIREKLGFKCAASIIDIHSLDNSNCVFRYTDRVSRVTLVGKFYGNKWINGRQNMYHTLRKEYMQREFNNLVSLRALGFDCHPHVVVRPLGAFEECNCLLLEEYVFGSKLENFIPDAIHLGKDHELKEKLTDLAWFLANLHTRSQTQERVLSARGLGYLERILKHLLKWNLISSSQYLRFQRLHARWRESGSLSTSYNVMTHGDPIFPNFFCTGDHGITAIDLERLWPGDRAMDLGCVVAELKHLFYLYSHKIGASEPYIEHFYSSYYSYLQDDIEDFSGLTERGRFYMATYELRICRNAWLNIDYRLSLIHEAELCMQI